MNSINDEELERRLREIRFKTSPALDARVRKLAESLGRGPRAAEQTAPRTRRRLFARLTKLAGAAVVALVVVLIAWWLLGRHRLEPSAYADLAEAVENTKAAEWVHMKGTMHKKEFEAWVSFQPFRMLVKAGDMIVVADELTETVSAYDAASRTIRIDERPVTEDDPLQGVTSLFNAVMKEIEMAKERGQAETRIEEREEMVGERTNKVFIITEAKGNETRITIDPALRRVIRIQHTTAQGKKESEFNVDYPETVPVDIYALGVPADARVLDMRPGADFKELEERVETAREAFGPSYYGIVCDARVLEDGSYEGRKISVVYKKGPLYRIESYVLRPQGDAEAAEQLWQTLSADDITALEGWLKTRSPGRVEFYDGTYQTAVQLDNEGRLQKQKNRIGPLNAKLARPIEQKLWGDPSLLVRLLPPMIGKSTRLLPPKEGPFRELLGVEHTWQGWRTGDRSVFYPGRRRQYFNPVRDYICEDSESEENSNAAWQEDKDWLKDLPADARERDFFHRQSRKVLKYAETSDGQWYARKILEEDQFGQRQTIKKAIFIYIDTTRSLSDDLMNPDSINSPAIFTR